jgi:hypothetical protein
MSFQYSKHSLEQIKFRELDQGIIDELLDHPDQIIKQDKHSVFYQKLVREGNKQYLYRILVNTEKQP